MIRTIIVDDEILSRIGIQSFIDRKEDIEVVGVFGSAEEALEFMQGTPVDVVITDIEMCEMDGLEFIGLIRQEQLADGIIILSCHESFSYAQEAIQKGINSYMIKHSITEDVLIQEVLKVYRETRGTSKRRTETKKSPVEASGVQSDKIYSVCTIKWHNAAAESAAGLTDQTDQIMFLHLLENIAEEHRLYTVFAPHDKNVFLMFQQDKTLTEEARQKEREESLDFIYSSIQNYIAEKMVLGVSSFYTDLTETNAKYDEAMYALNQGFYGADRDVYYYHRSADAKTPDFSMPTYNMLEAGWEETFTAELDCYLQEAKRRNILADHLKTQLVHSIQRILLHILDYYGISESKIAEQGNLRLNSVPIHQAATVAQLRNTIQQQISSFQQQLDAVWNHDDLAEVFCYIDDHLCDRITIEDLTSLSYMSTSTFCKKFKDRTGLTLVQYLNVRRIEKAKIYLSNPKYSLDDVAELTGFTSTNYLVRVFKRITNQTISEYRKHFSIS